MAVVLLGTTACGNQEEDLGEGIIKGENGLVTIVDDEGNKISFDKPFEKIISMYSAHTENLYYLGVGDKLIGNYKTGIYPPEAAFLDMYSYDGDPEEVIAAAPDLVLIRPFVTAKVPEYVNALKNAGITVVSLYPETYEDFEEYILKLALLTGCEDEAKQRLSEFYANIDNINQMTRDIKEKETVFFEATETNIRTVSKGSMVDLAINFAGGLNLAEGAEPMSEGGTISAFGVEKVLANADNIDVYVSQRGAMNSGGNLISIAERSGYDTIKAVKEGRVYLINEKIISSPTFRYYKGVRELARFMYPDLMDDYLEYDNDDPATKESYSEIIVKMMHLPIYLPSSSKYYETEADSDIHLFGLFEDVHWNDQGFDAIETAVYGGYVDWSLGEDDKEYFYPQNKVTREQLAKTIFLIGDFSSKKDNTLISDLDSCATPKIIQSLVDNGVFSLENGNFNPTREITNREAIEALKKVAF